ncbi:MAG: hypothetical protein ACRDGA_14125, partial [Bacteroidota bacterium]
RVSLSKENVDALLDVFVLAQDVSYEEVSSDRWKRTVRAALEARLRSPGAQEVQYLGSLDFSSVDTVSQQEQGWWNSSERTLLGISHSAFERIITPLVVIAAAVVVVYLFFTVRN